MTFHNYRLYLIIYQTLSILLMDKVNLLPETLCTCIIQVKQKLNIVIKKYNINLLTNKSGKNEVMNNIF